MSGETDDIMKSYDLLTNTDEGGLGSVWENLQEFIDQTNGENVIGLPDGRIEVYIQSNDSIHITNPNGEKIDGINSEIPNIEGLKVTAYVDGENVYEAAVVGAEAEKFIGMIDLTPGSPTFGLMDKNFGFKNVKNYTMPFFGQGRYKASGEGLYIGKGEQYNVNAYNSIYDHPNTKVAILTQLFQLDLYADTYNLDKEQLVEELRGNGAHWVADRYEEIANKELTHEGFLRDGYTIDSIEERNNNESEFNNSELSNVEIFEEISEQQTNDPKTIIEDELENHGESVGIALYEPLDVAINELFKDDDERFVKSFGVEKDSFVALKYPHDAVYGSEGTIGGQDHIILEQFSYSPPQQNQLKTSNLNIAEEVTTGSPYLEGVQRNSVLRTFLGMVKMPIPNNLTFSNGVAWGDGRANPLEMAAFMTAQNAVRQAVRSGDFGQAFGSIGGDIKKILSSIQGGAVSGPTGEAISAIISQFALSRAGINVDANQMLSRTVGTVINPNLELLFNGPKLRNFVFSFNFAPNDELDASVMRRIQRFFKQGMAPGRSNENRIFLGSPNIFRIRYRTNEGQRIKGLPIHKICALTTCEINYAPDGVYQSYEDSAAGSSPVRTIMNLNFTELTPIFRNDYLNDLEPGDPLEFSDEFGSPKGLGGFEPISLEDTGF
tara:strand:+ start:119 stop:2107 length:1989 start_codon:yes stop_codon:yes gene_type:complete